MLERFDIIMLDDNKEYSVVEILAIKGVQHLIAVGVDNEGNLNYNELVIIKQENNELIKVIDYDELKEIEKVVGPYLKQNNS